MNLLKITFCHARWATVVGLSILMLLGFSGTSVAQDVQHFHPVLGPWNYFSTDGAKVGPNGQLVTAVHIHYASNPLVRRNGAGNIEEIVVSDLTTAEFLAAWALTRRLAVEFALPLAHATTPSSLDVDDGSGTGDLRISPKLILLGAKRASGLGIAIKAPMSFPTAGDEHEFSSRQFSVAPTLIAEYSARFWRMAANLGYRWLPTRPETLPALAVGDGVRWSGALGFRPYPREFELAVEFFGTNYTDVAQTGTGPQPVEMMAGFKVFGAHGLTFSLGVGGGLVKDFSSPELRISGGLSWSMRSAASGGTYRSLGDQDGDGVKDDADACPDVREDLDGFQDADGCPDADNDGDGVLDRTDQCPSHAEDLDGFKDRDGCPDPDNDNDGVADDVDRCPMHPENRNGLSDEDGCPDDDKVIVEHGRIRHLQKIYFDTGKSSIQLQSYPILDRIASAIIQRPQLKRIRVEGHTDAFGPDKMNQKLAEARAEAVRQYLVHSGVEEERVEFRGHGETRLIGDGRSPVSARLSRRVEFVILRRADD
jgi:outer membrane protein OmpA-like peptidoglycan-associated protein